MNLKTVKYVVWFDSTAVTKTLLVEPSGVPSKIKYGVDADSKSALYT